MKLKDYLKKNKNPAVIARNIIQDKNKLGVLYGKLKSKGWNVTTDELVDILNDLYKDKNILFHNSHKPKKELVTSATIVAADPKISKPKFFGIEIELSDKAGKYFRRFSKNDKQNHFFDLMKNDMISSIVGYLTHEIRHYQQFLKAGKHYLPPSEDSGLSYYSDPNEIDAFASQAAFEMLKSGTSNTLKMFMGHTEINPEDEKKTKNLKKKVRSRFLKKFNKNLDFYR